MMITQQEKDYQRARREYLVKEITELVAAYTDDTGLIVNRISINLIQHISGEVIYGPIEVEVRL